MKSLRAARAVLARPEGDQNLAPVDAHIFDDLDYMHARYYSPHFGRFLSPDPIGGSLVAPLSWNANAYVGGNPVGLVDPYGLYIDANGVEQVGPPEPVYPGGGETITVTGPPEIVEISRPGPPQIMDPPGIAERIGGLVGEAIGRTVCPPTSHGVSVDLSTIGMSDGDLRGVNLQYVPGVGLGYYGYRSIREGGVVPGVSLTINKAYGSGPWEGVFDQLWASGLKPVTAGVFVPHPFSFPTSRPSEGWYGGQFGLSLGSPGVAGAEVDYELERDLSFLMPWCF